MMPTTDRSVRAQRGPERSGHSPISRFGKPILLVITLSALLSGVVAWAAKADLVANVCWIAGTAVAVFPALWWVVAALRRGRLGADVLAVLSLIGALAVGEYLAGALIAVMLATGQALEAAASRRATKDLRALLDNVPATARRRTPGGVTVVPLADVVVGDVVVVGPGESIPVDGEILSDGAFLDESVLTGESALVTGDVGASARSGAVNAGNALTLRATATAADSTYSGIVALAQQAAAESAPVVRLADRIAAWFLPLALGVAGAAWMFSGTAARAVAVLVVATPCPLLLAAPVAIVSGLSRASRIGVVIRGGAALENLGKATTLVLDKTGTLTTGRPRGTEVLVAPGWDREEVLRLAASADQLSPHVLAKAIVDDATRRGVTLSYPTDVVEHAGAGVSATVDGRTVSVGSEAPSGDIPQWVSAALSRSTFDGSVIAWVGIDHRPVGAILIVDPLRPDAARTVRRLRAAGLTRLVMLTGDRPAPAEQVALALGLDEARSQQSPTDKVEGVRAERARAVTAMVGDGVNDAPALAAATVGIAMGARGSTASSEAADIILTTDRIDRLADAMTIARRTRRIALQSASVGMALSLVAMAFAAFGLLPPTLGALLQEGIDVAVILNALRALRGDRAKTPPITDATRGLLRRFSAEHDEMRDDLQLLREAGQLLSGPRRTEALAVLSRCDAFVQQVLLPHEQAEELMLYPALADPLGSPEATATMSRMHAEIGRLARRLHEHRKVADAAGAVRDDQRDDLLACLYGLYALLSLHFIQEEENYFALTPVEPEEGLLTRSRGPMPPDGRIIRR